MTLPLARGMLRPLGTPARGSPQQAGGHRISVKKSALHGGGEGFLSLQRLIIKEELKMPIHDKLVKESIRKTLSNMKCESCGQHYKPDNVCFRGHRESYWFISVYCLGCKTLIPGIVRVGTDGISEAVTHSNQAQNSELSAPVDSNDIAGMYAFLKDFNGDFRALFAET
jgi:hypothetical protein